MKRVYCYKVQLETLQLLLQLTTLLPDLVANAIASLDRCLALQNNKLKYTYTITQFIFTLPNIML